MFVSDLEDRSFFLSSLRLVVFFLFRLGGVEDEREGRFDSVVIFDRFLFWRDKGDCIDYEFFSRMLGRKMNLDRSFSRDV